MGIKPVNISLVIDSVCKELGIPYCSGNPHSMSLYRDAQKLGKIYLQLKEMIGIIVEIEDRHEIGDLRDKFDAVVEHLEDTDHELIKLAHKLKEKND